MSLQAQTITRLGTVLEAIDTSGKATAIEARDFGVAAVRRVLPSRSGRLHRGTVGRARKSPTGYTIEVGPTSRVKYPSGVSAKEVTRFVAGGTGVHGPKGRPIRPRKARAFALPGGIEVASVQGQAAQHPYERVQGPADAAVERILTRGADEAAAAAERALDGAIR